MNHTNNISGHDTGQCCTCMECNGIMSFDYMYCICMVLWQRRLMALLLLCCGVTELLSADRVPSTRSRRLTAFRSDLGRKRELLGDEKLNYDEEMLPEIERRSVAFRSDLGKRLQAFRSDLGKRPSYGFRSDLGKRQNEATAADDEEKRFAFRSDLGKRVAFRSDLGKRLDASKKATSAFRSDLGKRLTAFRSDLGKRA